MSLTVSVVVPTYRRRDLLARCLDGLLAQDYDRSAYEVIVADDEANSDTCRLVSGYAMRAGRGPRVRYIAVKETHGPAAARNRGWRAACGQIIAFTDDDCVPQRGWLSAARKAFEDGADGVSGRLIMPLGERPTDYEYDASHLQHSEFVTANCFYRKDVLDRVGGFDERFRGAWREDSDLFFTMLEHGAQLVHAEDALVVHPVRPAQWGISLKQQRKSMYNALLYKKHRELYRTRVGRPFPWNHYLALGSLAAGAAGIAAGAAPVAAACLGAWMLLTGRFCAMRLRNTARTPAHIAEMVVTSALIPPLSVYWRLRGALKFHVAFV